jgi:ATP-dependent Clp protease ATP-binding subunit ClpC
MYERFTDRARKVMQLANREAQRFNHEYIGTEHILIGLCREGSGVAANVLRELGCTLERVIDQVEQILQHGPGGEHAIGRLPHTPWATKVIERAVEEARGLRHNWVGTEHLLLGLVRENEAVASQVLTNLGVSDEAVRKTILARMSATTQPVPPPILNEDQLRVFEDLIRQLSETRDRYVAEQDLAQAARYRDAIGSLRLLLSRLS